MKDFRLKIKPQRGVTYECYMGYSDRMGGRVRRGRRYHYVSDSFFHDYYFYPVSGKGFAVMVPKEKFASHFCPVNPVDCCDE
jgi:hypothetical protein